MSIADAMDGGCLQGGMALKKGLPRRKQSERIECGLDLVRGKSAMADTPESTSLEQATPEELAEVITGLEQYRERLVEDTLTIAQRAKVKKAQAMENLEPQLAQIDAQLEVLRNRQASLAAQN